MPCKPWPAPAGLESLSLCYEEEEGPEVNLEGNLDLLAALEQVGHTSLAVPLLCTLRCCMCTLCMLGRLHVWGR